MINANRVWINEVLSSLSFVTWDRFTVQDDPEEEPDFQIYGWIERDDDYKDFVLITLYPQGHMIKYTTSSPKYSKKISEILFRKVGNHMPCLRVEKHFETPNMVKLK